MRTKKWIAPVGIAVSTMLLQFPSVASAAELRLRWSELPPLVVSHDVTLVLPTGAAIGGQAVAIRNDALVVDIRKTSDANAYPKGQTVIPRSSVSVLKVVEMRGNLGQTVGGVTGAIGGLLLAGAVIFHTKLGESGGVATYITIPVVASIAGHYIGRNADRRVTLISVVPD